MGQKRLAERKANFTKGYIDRLEPTSNNKLYEAYYDTQVSKLAVLVHKSGKKTFYIVTKHNGRTERVKLGIFPELSLENARKKALEVLGELAKDVNPQDAKRALRKEWRFKDACDWFIKDYAPYREGVRLYT